MPLTMQRANLSLKRHKVADRPYYRMEIGPPEGVLGKGSAIDLDPASLLRFITHAADELYKNREDDGIGVVGIEKHDDATTQQNNRSDSAEG